ncbi:hypothetical protein IV203_015685 [Nitzschia inconspicua]|uniref:Uncharacterized protein n=1 Tax=Nitzschia inconspicua TaxID=303405 RepID=A0A9K3PTQ1_9STRA|nr:hypothetical protein IV203_015685 [Nitzschia inconspicua]
MPRTKKSSSRSDPLLSAENGTVVSGRRQKQPPSTSRRISSDASTTSPPLVGKCGHAFIVLLPLMACGMVVSILGLLILNFEGGESIQTTSISAALEVYQPYSEIVLLASFAAVLTFAVTAARNIQIAVSMQRGRMAGLNLEQKPGASAYSSSSRIVNATAALMNVTAYAGFVLLIAFKVNQEEPSYAILMHTIGAFVYFGGISIYSLAHAYLLYQQDQPKYPLFLKWLFIGLSLGVVLCVVVFGVNFRALKPLEFEWAAVFLSAIYVGLFSVLFHIDNVDDEIRDFFGKFLCCRGSCFR